MSKTYFIGGAPRAGKTTTLFELIQQRPMFAASTDMVRAVAKSLISPELNPRLHKTDRGAFGSENHIVNMRNNPQLVLEQELGEAEETWKAVADFISYSQNDGKDTAIEGVAVLPSELAKLKFDHRAVFIVNTSDQTESILQHAQSYSEDWLNKYDEETVRLYASFNKHWNKYYAGEAAKFNYPVIEIGSNNFQSGIDEAVATLLAES